MFGTLDLLAACLWGLLRWSADQLMVRRVPLGSLWRWIYNAVWFIHFSLMRACLEAADWTFVHLYWEEGKRIAAYLYWKSTLYWSQKKPDPGLAEVWYAMFAITMISILGVLSVIRVVTNAIRFRSRTQPVDVSANEAEDDMVGAREEPNQAPIQRDIARQLLAEGRDEVTGTGNGAAGHNNIIRTSADRELDARPGPSHGNRVQFGPIMFHPPPPNYRNTPSSSSSSSSGSTSSRIYDLRPRTGRREVPTETPRPVTRARSRSRPRV